MNNDLKPVETLRRINEMNDLSAVKIPSFSLSITRYVTDVDGTLINKNSIGNFAKVDYPVFLFNAFDYAGAYLQGFRELPILNQNNLFFIDTFTYKNTFNLLNFSGANNIKEKLTVGDQIFRFSDSEQLPNFFIWFVISSELRSYASILKNPIDTGMQLHSLKYFADNETQFERQLSIVECDEVGNVKKDETIPQKFKTVDYQQEGFILIPFNDWRLTNFRGIYLYMAYECDVINLIFRYRKV